MTAEPQTPTGWAHDELLAVLARADSPALKALAEPLISQLPDIEVFENRTGLVMLPMRDTVEGTHFHLGEVLMSEARISAGGIEGYGMRRGRDLEAAMAMAVVELAAAHGVALEEIATFLKETRTALDEIDRDVLRRVEATRVSMETF